MTPPRPRTFPLHPIAMSGAVLVASSAAMGAVPAYAAEDPGFVYLPGDAKWMTDLSAAPGTTLAAGESVTIVRSFIHANVGPIPDGMLAYPSYEFTVTDTLSLAASAVPFVEISNIQIDTDGDGVANSTDATARPVHDGINVTVSGRLVTDGKNYLMKPETIVNLRYTLTYLGGITGDVDSAMTIDQCSGFVGQTPSPAEPEPTFGELNPALGATWATGVASPNFTERVIFNDSDLSDNDQVNLAVSAANCANFSGWGQKNLPSAASLSFGLAATPDDSGTETPPVDGGETPPVDGGETPPVDGGETPPVDGGVTPPGDGETPSVTPSTPPAPAKPADSATPAAGAELPVTGATSATTAVWTGAGALAVGAVLFSLGRIRRARS